MPKKFIKVNETTRSPEGKYYIRDHICERIYDAIIESHCTKTNLYIKVIPIEELITPVTQQVNVEYIETMFTSFPDEVKKLMYVTDFVDEINKLNIQPKYTYSGESGEVALSFAQTGSFTGTLSITYNWRKFGEFTTHCKDTETHVINGIIKHNKRFYAITPKLIDWIQEHPDEHVSIDKLFIGQ